MNECVSGGSERESGRVNGDSAADSAQGRGLRLHFPLPPAGGLGKVAAPAAARAGTGRGAGWWGKGRSRRPRLPQLLD